MTACHGVFNQIDYRWNDFIVGVAESVAAGSEIFVTHFVDGDLERGLQQEGNYLPVLDGVSGRHALVPLCATFPTLLCSISFRPGVSMKLRLGSNRLVRIDLSGPGPGLIYSFTSF